MYLFYYYSFIYLFIIIIFVINVIIIITIILIYVSNNIFTILSIILWYFCVISFYEYCLLYFCFCYHYWSNIKIYHELPTTQINQGHLVRKNNYSLGSILLGDNTCVSVNKICPFYITKIPFWRNYLVPLYLIISS